MKKKNNTLAGFVADDNAPEFYISVAYLLFTRDVDKKLKQSNR